MESLFWDATEMSVPNQKDGTVVESIQGVSDCKVNTDTYMWVFCEWNASQLTKHPLHANSSALAAYIGVNYRIPEWTFWTWKFYKCFSKPGGKFYFWKKFSEKFWKFFFCLECPET